MVRDQGGGGESFRRAYAAATGDERRLPAFAFGDTPALADELGRLVVEGPKRATAVLLADLEQDGDAVPAVGDRTLVLDGRGRGLCVIETVDVRVGELGSVDPAFAWDEGEGERTREDWLAVHRRFFARRCAALGLALADDLPTVFERFAVVWPRTARRPALAVRDGLRVRMLRFDERVWAARTLEARWGATLVVARGVRHDAARLPGLVASRTGQPLGLATFRPWPGRAAELVTLDALVPGTGAGRLLVEALETLGRREGWTRVWTVTTNDNTPALRLYQRAGWDLVALHRCAVAQARRHKPSIPRRGLDDITIRHELELERLLG